MQPANDKVQSPQLRLAYLAYRGDVVMEAFRKTIEESYGASDNNPWQFESLDETHEAGGGFCRFWSASRRFVPPDLKENPILLTYFVHDIALLSHTMRQDILYEKTGSRWDGVLTNCVEAFNEANKILAETFND